MQAINKTVYILTTILSIYECLGRSVIEIIFIIHTQVVLRLTFHKTNLELNEIFFENLRGCILLLNWILVKIVRIIL